MITLLIGAALAGPAEDYAAGIAADRAGDLNAAAGHFTAALEGGGVDADVYLGLGNVLYRQGDRPRAITAYMRGLWLDPAQGDLRANLEHCLQQTADRVEPPRPDPGPFVWAGLWSPRTSVTLTGLAVGLGLARLAWRRRRGQGAVDGLGVGLFGAALLLAAGAAQIAGSPPPAVVAAEALSVRSAPTPGSVELFVLHAGAVVAVEERSPGAALVALPDGRKGWVVEGALLSADPAAPFPAAGAAPAL